MLVRAKRSFREFFVMCTNGLETLDSREAKLGDLLTTTNLGAHGTIGFAARGEAPGVAVCLQPGTTVKVTGVVPESLTDTYAITPGDRAVFQQRDLPEGDAGYRDGLVFDAHQPGVMVLFQDLLPDLCVEVVSIPVA